MITPFWNLFILKYKQYQNLNTEKKVFSIGVITLFGVFYYFYSVFLIYSFCNFKVAFFLNLYLLVDTGLRFFFNNLEFTSFKKIIYLPIKDTVIVSYLYSQLLFSLQNLLSAFVAISVLLLTGAIFEILFILAIQLYIDVLIKFTKTFFLWKQKRILVVVVLQFGILYWMYGQFLEVLTVIEIIILLAAFLVSQIYFFIYLKNNFKRLLL